MLINRAFFDERDQALGRVAICQPESAPSIWLEPGLALRAIGTKVPRWHRAGAVSGQNASMAHRNAATHRASGCVSGSSIIAVSGGRWRSAALGNVLAGTAHGKSDSKVETGQTTPLSLRMASAPAGHRRPRGWKSSACSH